jgi:serine/threonine-protein kinase
VELTPTPEATVSPEVELTPTPEATVSPEVELTPTPEATVSPEVELTPTPEATVSPEVELTPTPQPSVSAAPDPPASSTPIPEPSATNIPVIPPPSSNSETRDSAENKSSSLPVPVIRTGTPDNKIRQKLGAPTSVNSGLWKNSRAVLYKNVIPGQVDLGYLFDVDTGTVKQTEASFAQAAGLPTLKKTVNNFLGGKTPASVQQGLEQIYHRQNHQYSFVVGNLKGTIQRNSSDRIYIGVWEADFH